MDVRYEAMPVATESGRRQGFVAHSPADPASVGTYAQWLLKWEGIAPGKD